jgi:rare lipoprotein A
MRLYIGISLACLVTSACAIDKTPEEGTSRSPGGSTGFPRATNDQSPVCAEALVTDGSSTEHSSEQVERRLSSVEPATNACGGVPNPCWSLLRTTGMSLFGKAAWYNLVGRQTANGEILDTVTATAAHRSLPLASCAKVTDLDNGRSVVVKINDRGPVSRRLILDLSPRAADALDMKRVGVAAVLIEPLVNQAAPTLAVFQISGVAISQ